MINNYNQKMNRKILFLIGVMAIAFSMKSAIIEPITWIMNIEKTDSAHGTVILKASIDNGWHLYGTNLPAGGPNPTSIELTASSGIKMTGVLTPSKPPVEKFDPTFQLDLNFWEGEVSFSQDFEIVGTGSQKIDAEVTFQGCNDMTCIPPSTISLSKNVDGLRANDADNAASGTSENVEITDNTPNTNDNTINTTSDNSQQPISSQSWWVIFVWGFGGGLLALLTPCVWPLIPMTVSFFLKKSSSKSRSVRDAMIYGLSIIVIYLALGLLITLLFGASKLNDLATNAVFNIIFFLILVIFAISFFGAFEITLPSKWSNSVDNKAEKATGLMSIFFMAFTLALVSFSCTGPIIGTLLVEAVSIGNFSGPAIGMTGFALALALPFTLFAIFPTWLKELPRSGGWLNSVKVVLGFLELALSLKFLSVADLAYGWGILDREVFLALWIVIFALLGMYLLGKIRFSHDDENEGIGVGRFFLAIVSLSFAVYMLPGLWGAPLKAVSAFVPPLETQDFNLYHDNEIRKFDNYDDAVAFAVQENKPLLIDFSGYGCVNCRKMEGKVFDTPEVSGIIDKDFVFVKLMVDDKHKLTEPVTVEENGRTTVLKTIGDKWSYLQRSRFGSNTQPYYVIVDPATGRQVGQSRSYDENVEQFVKWLEAGSKMD